MSVKSIFELVSSFYTAFLLAGLVVCLEQVLGIVSKAGFQQWFVLAFTVIPLWPLIHKKLYGSNMTPPNLQNYKASYYIDSVGGYPYLPRLFEGTVLVQESGIAYFYPDELPNCCFSLDRYSSLFTSYGEACESLLNNLNDRIAKCRKDLEEATLVGLRSIEQELAQNLKYRDFVLEELNKI